MKQFFKQLFCRHKETFTLYEVYVPQLKPQLIKVCVYETAHMCKHCGKIILKTHIDIEKET